MTAVAIGQAHIKVWFREGALALERCEDDHCLVDEEGHAACGRVACPRCGCSGANLSLGNGACRCSCGHWWASAR